VSHFSTPSCRVTATRRARPFTAARLATLRSYAAIASGTACHAAWIVSTLHALIARPLMGDARPHAGGFILPAGVAGVLLLSVSSSAGPRQR
jgi:hypothetical protein